MNGMLLFSILVIIYLTYKLIMVFKNTEVSKGNRRVGQLY